MVAQMQSDPVHSKALPDLIGKLLAERQEILVLLNRLAGLKSYDHEVVAEAQPLLQRFCQVLVDYVALGHFEVYQCFEDHVGDTAHCRLIKRLARELYPRIHETTRVAIDFNDRYDSQEQAWGVLCEDLSRLGEQLATRIELEDRLITAIRAAA